jgi:holin-like protein
MSAGVWASPAIERRRPTTEIAVSAAIFAIVCFQLGGEAVRLAFGLPVPGPVIGMFALAAVLVMRDRLFCRPIPPQLSSLSDTLIGMMGLFFVPAGAAIVTEAALLRQAWLPIVAGLVASTILSLLVTGLVMRRAPGAHAALERAGERPG